MPSPQKGYATNVFINCPFDRRYKRLLYAITYSVLECNFRPRCALEVYDSGQVRIEKILRIISECRIGIHDISRTTLDSRNNLPRFNMPLELGLFLGAQRFGNKEQKEKVSLIMDKEPYRFQKFISDIAGQDIRAHRNSDSEVIRLVRDLLSHQIKKGEVLPGGRDIQRRFRNFYKTLPTVCKKAGLLKSELTFNDYVNIVNETILKN